MFARLMSVAAISLLCSATVTPLLAQEPPAKSTEFAGLMDHARMLFEDLDFTALRFEWTNLDEYNPYLDISDLYKKTIPALETELEAKRFSDATNRCNSTAHVYQLDLKWNLRCEEAYEGVGDAETAAFHDFMVGGLVKSIMNSGNGKTPETAYEVITLAEQYAAFAVLEVSKGGQSLVVIDGVNFDRITVTNNATGEESFLYFKLDAVFRWLDRH